MFAEHRVAVIALNRIVHYRTASFDYGILNGVCKDIDDGDEAID